MGNRRHNFISLGIGVLYLAVLQTFSTPQPAFGPLIIGLLFFSGLLYSYNRWYLRQNEKWNLWLGLRAILPLWSGFGIFLLLPTPFLRAVFLFLSIGVIYLHEVFIDNTSENVTINLSTLSLFGFFLGIFGLKHYFPPVNSSWLYVIYLFLICTISYLTSRIFYEFTPLSTARKNAASIIIAFFSSQLFWAFSFLPFHFSALAALFFNIVLLLLVLNYYFYFQNLTYKKFQFTLMLIFITSSVVLLATPWRIIK